MKHLPVLLATIGIVATGVILSVLHSNKPVEPKNFGVNISLPTGQDVSVSNQKSFFNVLTTSTAASLQASSTLIVNRTTSTFESGRWLVDSNGNQSSSGTLQNWVAPGAVVSSTFLVAGSNANVSGTLYANSQVILTSSSYQGALTVSGALGASSTLQVTGQSTFYSSIVGTSTFAGTGVYLNASTSVGNALTVTGLLQASSTLQATGLETLYSGFLSVASSSIASSLNVVGNLNASSSLFVGSPIPNNYLTISSGNQTYSSTSLQVTNQFTELTNTSNTFKFVGNGVGYNTTTIMVTSTAADPTLHGGAEFIMKDALGYCKRAYIMGTSWVIEPCVSGAGTQYTAQAQVGPSTTIFNSTF